MSDTIEVVEAYRGFAPLCDVRRAVRLMVGVIPRRYVGGLGTVVLTNLAALNREQRRKKSRSRGRPVTVDQVLGRYHPAWNGTPAWVELFVDQIFKDCPGWVQYVAPLRDMLVGNTLFHEIGHHIHRTQEPEHSEKERVADRWVGRFSRQYFSRRYWYLMPVVLVALPVLRFGRLVHKWSGRIAKRITTA